MITGSIIIRSESSLVHSGVSIELKGTLVANLSARSIGLFESLSSSIKPVTLVQKSVFWFSCCLEFLQPSLSNLFSGI